jgi:hypothetical protein
MFAVQGEQRVVYSKARSSSKLCISEIEFARAGAAGTAGMMWICFPAAWDCDISTASATNYTCLTTAKSTKIVNIADHDVS